MTTIDKVRDDLLAGLLRFVAAAGLVAYVPSMWACFVSRYWAVAVVDTLVYGLVLVAAFSRRIAFKGRLATIIGASLTLGGFLLYATGADGAGYLWLILGVVISALLGRRTAVALTMAAVGLEMAAYAAASALGLLQRPQALLPVLVITSNLALICLVIVFLIGRLHGGLLTALEAEARLTGRLEEELATTRQTKDELAASLSVMESLLRELDHRVRNNMQIVLAVLDQEADRSGDLRGAAEKVRAVAVVNDLFLAQPGGGRVRLDELLRLFLEPGRELGAKEGAFSWTIQPMEWTVCERDALPLALTVAELIPAIRSRLHAAELGLAEGPGRPALSLRAADGRALGAAFAELSRGGGAADHRFEFAQRADGGGELLLALPDSPRSTPEA